MGSLSRRDFLAGSGALLVTFRLGPLSAQPAQGGALPRILSSYSSIDAWIRIGADESVTVFTGKVELGQGIKTAIVQIAAEELDVEPGRISLITADTGSTPNEAYTAGSRSIEDSGMAVRHAAAEARRMLLELAAEHLAAPQPALTIDNGLIRAGERSVSFGTLLDGRALDRDVTGEAPLKRPDQYRVVGRTLPRVDLPAKVYGGEAFIQDLRLDGMLHARTVHPPGPGAELLSVDRAAVAQLPGVAAVVRDGDFLAVIAAREEQAVAAAAELRAAARWSDGPVALPPDGSALEGYMRGLAARETRVAERGRAGNAGTRIRASYLRPFQAHASIGPSCALAVLDGDRLRVWTHSQGIYPLRDEMARVLRIPADSMHLTFVESAGCYGHNGADDAAIEAALLARAAPGRPVRLQWSREDEFGWEPLGAAMLIDCDAQLDAAGRIVDWHSVVRGFPHPGRPGFGAGDGANLLAAQLIRDSLPPRGAGNAGLARNAVPLYALPSMRIDEHFIADSPVRVSSLRALGAYANVFALESFIDELAAAANADPVAFRLAHLEDQRAGAVIEAAARAANWSARDALPPGRGLGIGFAQYNNSAAYCAVIADAEVARSGQVRVHHLWAATDCGQVISPDGVRNQIEGGAVQSTSWTLLEAVRFDRRRFADLNWQGYPILRFDAVPETQVVLIDRPGSRPLGAGEASQGPAAAAIANAVFAASGARVRKLPLSPERVAAAMS